MPKTKKPKLKLLPAKEARALVEKQIDMLAQAALKIHSLKQEVESLEGARANLRMMYDTHEQLKNQAISEKIDAQATSKQIMRDMDKVSALAAAYQSQVRGYEAEGAVHMWVRSMKKAIAPVTRKIQSLIERLQYRFGRRR